DMKYTADFTAGQCLKSSMKYKEAKDYYYKLIDNNAYFKKYGDIYNEIADCDYEAGSDSLAEALYKKVTKDYDRTRAAALAYYRLGLIYGKRAGGLSQAFNYFRKAQSVAGECPEAVLAREKLNNLRLIRFLTTPKDSVLTDSGFTSADSALADSISKLSPSARHFRIAEAYLYQLNDPDSAVNHYRAIDLIDTSDDTTRALKNYKMKAIYATAWIMDNLKKNSKEAEDAYKEVIERYPATEIAKASAMALKLSESQYLTGDDSLAQKFTHAETLYYNAGKCKEAYNEFVDIFKFRPTDTIWSAKALLAAGWVAEDCLNDSTLAIKAYTTLDTAFPKTEQAQFAKRKLKGRKEAVQTEITVSRPGSASASEAGQKGDSTGITGVKAEEKPNEDAWVTFDGASTDAGELKGKRSSDAIGKAMKPLIDALDETYIDLIDEGLKQEGVLTIGLLIKSTGEITKVRPENGEINDKVLIEQTRTMLDQMQFDE
ncbi:MAG: tetratricopeptide repeat protein, partial [Fibrobacteres bacterium]|nr:tetratricopeptide repeat protein [Fibrobacterota bacterium]